MNQIASIKKTDDELQIAYAEVYVPDVPDAHQEFMTKDEVRKMGHWFLSNGSMKAIDTDHDNIENGSCVVESFIARKGDLDFIEGSWVVGVHIPEAAVWVKVKNGELNGFSIQALVNVTAREVEMDIPEFLSGGTDSTDGHAHSFKVQLSEDGSLVGGVTDTVEGHCHKIRRGTKTDDANNHSHRFSFVEQLV